MSFNFEIFADSIENELKGNCVGYSFVVSYKDEWKVKRAGGKARTAFNPPALDMTTNVRFNLASVSKAITAVAMLKVLHQRPDVSLGSVFHTHLPEHWQVHQSLRQITFEQLLTHRSGFRFTGGLEYAALKNDMAAGVDVADIGNDTDGHAYQGENFAIMRLLIPALAGYAIPQDANGGSALEVMQAAMYAGYYIDYVQKELFAKASLPNLKCEAEAFIGGVCYHFPYNNKPGTDFGDHTLVAGSKGWVMSAAELAKLFRIVHHTEKILPKWLSDDMKTKLMGYDATGATSEGVDFYWKNGRYPGSQNAGELNSLIIVYNNNVQVALIINSELNNSKGMVGIINEAHDLAYQKIKIVSGDDIKRP